VAYTPDITKFADGGLNLNAPVDLVPKAQYSRFTNAISKIEGTLQQRDGITKVCDIDTSKFSNVNSIFRLTEKMAGTSSERLVGNAKGNLYSLLDPPGNSPIMLPGVVYDGKPLSIISFLYFLDPIPWAIIANGAAMMKHRPGYYQNLGLDPPTVQASASAGGAGNLDSSGGIGYDWRYTYYNDVSGSESNPSPITTVGPATDITKPTAFSNPDPNFAGSVAFSNPGDAFDGNPGTFAQGIGPTSGALNYAACQWNVWSAGLGEQYSTLVLTVIATSQTQVSITGQPTQTNPGGGIVQYSVDGGVTWSNMTVGNDNNYTANLPQFTDLSNIRVAVRAPGSRTTAGPITITNQTTIQVFEIYATGTIAAGTTDVLSLTNQSAVVCVTPPTDPQDTSIRLYREGGTLPAGVWFLVNSYPVASLVQGTCGAGTVELDDNVADVDIENAPVLQFDNDHPVTSVQANNVNLPIIWGPYPEATPMVIGCGDPARPNAVYFSKEGNADEWPPQNFLFISPADEPVQNGCIYSTRCYVFTTESVYILLAGLIPGVTFSQYRTPAKHGLFARWGLCVGAKGMYFIAKDGIYVTDGGPEVSIVEETMRPLFPKQDAPQGVDTNGYFAPDFSQPDLMRLRYHNSEIWFGYIGLTDQTRHWLIFDEMKQRWRASDQLPAMDTVYSEPSTTSSLLLGGEDGVLYKGGGVDDNGAQIPVAIRTGAFDQGVPLKVKEYGTALFDIDPGGANITITPYVNGDTVASPPIFATGTGRQEVSLSLNDVLARNISFDIEWTGGTPVLYQLTIMYRPSATAMTHWELPPTSHGLIGWQHVRDAYISIRTNAPVTFAVTSDTTGQMVFTLPNTSNQKQKIYVPFPANKGKLYKYQFDSTAVFQLYAQETEVRAKSWNTVMGYQIAQILGAETPPAQTES